MPPIPEPMKWYTPLGLRQSRNELSVAWRVLVDQVTDCVEIKRSPLVKLPAVLFGTCLGVFASIVFAFNFEPPDNAEMACDQIFVIVLTPPFMILVGVALDAWTTQVNSRYWKGPLRFRYDSRNGELLFPRENVTYRQGDYSKLVLGCVRGAEMVTAKGLWGVKKVARGKSTQIFMLVLDQNDEWKRYNLCDDYNSDSNKWKTNESGSKQFIKVAEILRQHFQFEQFIKDYSKDECYTQQHGSG